MSAADERDGDYETFEDWSQSQITSAASAQMFRDFKAWAPRNNYGLDWKGHGELFSDTHTDAALDGFLGGYIAAMTAMEDIVRQGLEKN